MNLDAKDKKVLTDILERLRKNHLDTFKGELTIGELNGFLTALLEFKRRKWIESAFNDYKVEELFTLLDIVDEAQQKADEQDEQGKQG